MARDRVFSSRRGTGEGVPTWIGTSSLEEKRGWIQGRWVEKAGQRRRRYYGLNLQGREVLASQRRRWQVFVAAINRITGVEHA